MKGGEKYSEIGYNTTILLMKIRTSKLIKLSRKLEEQDKSYNSSLIRFPFPTGVLPSQWKPITVYIGGSDGGGGGGGGIS